MPLAHLPVATLCNIVLIHPKNTAYVLLGASPLIERIMLTSSISLVRLTGLVPTASSEVPDTCTIKGSELPLWRTLLSAARQTAKSSVSLVRWRCHESNLASKALTADLDMPVVSRTALEIACIMRRVRPGDTPSPLLKPSCASSALRLLTSLDSIFSTKWGSLPSSAAFADQLPY